MKIKDHIGKITWSFADKVIMVLFGLFTLFQLKYLDPSEYAFYAALLNINNWILMATDGFALQGLIQYGHKNKEEVNKLALGTSLIFSMALAIIFFVFKDFFANLADSESYKLSLAYLPLSVLLTIPKNYVTKIFYRELKFDNVFYLNFVFFGSQILATIYYIVNYNALNFEYMIEIYLFGSGISAVVAILMSFKYLKFSAIKELSIKKYLSFGLTVSQQSILHSIPKVYDLFIVSHFFGPSGAGVYQSAKTLYRTFDEASSAAHGLIYPAAVKLIAFKDTNQLVSMLSKAISMMLLVFIFLIFILNLGLTDYIINSFELTKYLDAIGIFNLLILSAVFLPFVLITPVLNAMEKHKLVLKLVLVSVIVSLVVFIAIGMNFSLEYMAFGLISYNMVLGVLSFIYLRKEVDFPFSMLFRSLGDIKNFIKK